MLNVSVNPESCDEWRVVETLGLFDVDVDDDEDEGNGQSLF